MEIGLFRPGALSGMNSHKLIKNFFTIELNFLSIYYQEEVYYSEPTWELGPAKKASMNLWLEEKEKTPKEIVLSYEAMKNNIGSTESGKILNLEISENSQSNNVRLYLIWTLISSVILDFCFTISKIGISYSLPISLDEMSNGDRS